MTLAVGLNPYGLTYTLGLQGNADGAGLEGFLEIAGEIGAQVVELHQPWLAGLDLAALARRLDGMVPVVSCGMDPAGDDAALECAALLGARVVRMALTRVLQGDRHAVDWPRLVDGVRARLARVAPRAAAAGLSVAIENHQDFTSADLMELCEEAGEAVGIALDTGNAFAVGEAPLEFARTVAPRVGTCTSRTTGCSPPTRATASSAARSATARPVRRARADPRPRPHRVAGAGRARGAPHPAVHRGVVARLPAGRRPPARRGLRAARVNRLRRTRTTGRRGSAATEATS